MEERVGTIRSRALRDLLPERIKGKEGTEYLPAVHRYTLYKGDEIPEFQRSYMYAMGESENTKCSRKIRMEQSSK